MEVILLERNANLGNVGDLVAVKNGYARNFLLPQGKALRATEQNKQEFEERKAQIEKENISKKNDAEKSSGKVNGQFVVLVRQAGEDGRLYGSVSSKDISDAASGVSGLEIKRSQVVQFTPIKALGIHTVKISLHPEVVVSVHVNVARTAGEAEIAKKEFLNPSKKEASESEEISTEVAQENAEEDGKHKKSKKKSAKVVKVELDDDAAA
jgi:large subunit ribosomal protein L9